MQHIMAYDRLSRSFSGTVHVDGEEFQVSIVKTFDGGAWRGVALHHGRIIRTAENEDRLVCQGRLLASIGAA